MFRTPPLKSEAKFATPAKQVIDTDLSSSPVGVNFEYGDDKVSHNNYKHFLPTPQSPSISTPSAKGLSISTSNEFQYYKGSGNYTSPLTSPVSVFSDDSSKTLASSPAASHQKYIPHSSVISNQNVIDSLEDFIIDPSFKFDVMSNQVIGKGSFSTVVKAKFNDHFYAIKVPSSVKNSRPIYREALNYKIISSYLQLHDFNCDEFPILNVYGLTYLTKANYPKLRFHEVAPCLVSSNLSSNLETLIKRISNEESKLHIGEDLWWKLAKELIMGLIVLRDCEIIHLDLKTSNILFDAVNDDFKIADFTSAGLKTDILKEFHEKAQSGLSIDITLQYAAPELINNSGTPPTYNSDLYSVGLILLSAAIGQEPYTEVLRQNDRSNFIYLTECIKKNKVLDLLSQKSLNILQSNLDAYNLIKMILIDRVDLDQIIGILNN